MTTNHPAHGSVSLERLHQIREILSKAAAQSDGGNLGYAMADAVKVIDGVLESMAREQVRREHAAWSKATFGDVGPVVGREVFELLALSAFLDHRDDEGGPALDGSGYECCFCALFELRPTR